MKIIKYLLIAVGILFAVYVVLCTMGPKEMKASKSMLMKASPEAIFEEYVDFNKWDAWSPWHKIDPNMKSTLTGTPGQVGHKQAWTSDHRDVGNGSQIFTEIRPNEFAKSEMRFMGDDSSPAFGIFELKSEGEGTMVTWSMDGGEVPFFARGIMKLMNMQAMVEKSFETGLTDLQKVAEAKPKKTAIVFEIIDQPEQWYVGIMHPKMNVKDITPAIFEADYGSIAKLIAEAGKTPGYPISIAHNYSEQTMSMDMENAMLVDGELKVASGMNCSKIPAGKVAKYEYKGPYEGTAAAWGAFMSELMKEHKKSWSGYEVYVSDPGMVTDKNELITWLIQPIQ
jgi:effector-binding domain-containing protein